MKIFAISILLQGENDDKSTTTTHTLHWRSANTSGEAIESAIAESKKLKPRLNVIDVLCGDIMSNNPTRLDLSSEKMPKSY